MAAPSVVVQGVSKRFVLHQARTGSFRELLTRRRASEKHPERDFWALKDIDFTVEPGHPLAIIGHNGSGKSTLLKLLTGILKPTQGRISIHGRIGALIEVGAGFHPDLTGRENVYLNGAILGATRREIDARFDHIVAFAGLESFIDTPVKRYSSGMYMRLGFSIVAHLEPEVLLIDEVLAVGDAQFQSRCLGFLKRFVAQGGSVVFVSHAMGQVRELCDRVLWLDHGKALGFGEAEGLIQRYESLVAEREDAEFKKLYPKEWAAQEEQKRRTQRWELLQERRTAARARRAAAREEAAAMQAEAAAHLRAAREEEARREDERLTGERKRLRAFEASWHAAVAAARATEDAARHAREAEAEEEERLRQESAPDRFRILGATLQAGDEKPAGRLAVGERALLHIRYCAGRPLKSAVIGVDFLRLSDGLHLFTVSNYDHQCPLPTPGEGLVSLWIDAVTLGQGSYRVRLTTFADCTVPEWFLHPEHVVENALEIAVDAGRFANGCAYMPTRWESRPLLEEPI